MIKNLLTLTVLLASLNPFNLFAAEYALKANDFLLLMNKGGLAFERAAMDDGSDIPDAIRKQLIEKQKERYPHFKESMWYTFMLRAKPYRYYIIFDWTQKKCVFTSVEEIPVQSAKYGIEAKVLEQYTEIPMSTCEKMYGFVSK